MRRGQVEYTYSTSQQRGRISLFPWETDYFVEEVAYFLKTKFSSWIIYLWDWGLTQSLANVCEHAGAAGDECPGPFQLPTPPLALPSGHREVMLHPG